MRKALFLAIVLSPLMAFAQLRIGIKAGLNFADVTKASSINSSSRSGFLAGLFISPKSKGILSSRTELIYSKQGYDYKNTTNTGNVNLDYILIPQLMSINITKYFSIQIGAQVAYLLNAKVDSSNGMSLGGNSSYGKLLNYYNRFDYGYAGGIEIHPVKGLLIGARYNVSLGNVYKDPSSYATGTTPPPTSFLPQIDAKNNVVQIFAGWIFGKSSKKKKP